MAKDKIRVNPSEGYLGGRVSKKMLTVAGTLLVVVLMLIFSVIVGKGMRGTSAPADTASTAPASADHPEEDAIISSAPATPAVAPVRPASAIPADTGKGAPSSSDAAQSTADNTLLNQSAQRETLRLTQMKEQQFEVALAAPTMIKVDLTGQGQAPAANGAQAASGGQQNPGSGSDGSADPNGQNEKEAFSQHQHSNTYLTHGREKPLGQWELKVGTLIPGVLISGLNSDLPGQVVATVSQNVWDSITHSQILIPQGAQLYGLYDSRVAYGQDRVLMAWTRINYPDGTTIELDGMGGIDTAGYAGFEDQVDHHYWKIFGNAFILGMISGVAQASISHDSGDSDSDRAQSINNGVTQQFANAGSSLIQKNLDVQPTITIRNGYKFNIMLNKDIVLPPWQSAE
ncbi:TraB/TrbI/VirB10 family type IV secretion system protein [Citrobacter koseri]|uniref:TrbI/VirB10 family protein n=1 Tax=Citrobacter koseri TaxID=545 RepID=UPI001F2303A1|nr:TrbI/VirB10 family protein [Citrobacter koseri]